MILKEESTRGRHVEEGRRAEGWEGEGRKGVPFSRTRKRKGKERKGASLYVVPQKQSPPAPRGGRLGISGGEGCLAFSLSGSS